MTLLSILLALLALRSSLELPNLSTAHGAILVVWKTLYTRRGASEYWCGTCTTKVVVGGACCAASDLASSEGRQAQKCHPGVRHGASSIRCQLWHQTLG
ncbi:hypothetical protein B0T24DRAFT_354145 [Lasiosphaeria ovina]|uniref:Secreted protein n=1 Tax=Lasiosphaeria ovina TaxID=92902 RepID=A0AAE0N396_9PEZI|nr:hypothetical protein B0T24DRAFT_354145 [Lasiosphaeria ovina]